MPESPPKNESLFDNPPLAAAGNPSTPNVTGTWRYNRPEFVTRRAPCRAACPLNEDVPAIMALNRVGAFKAAFNKIVWENPYPGVCGYICPHRCERACNRNHYDEPLAIRDLERFLATEARQAGWEFEPAVTSRPRAAAVLGDGPAGSTCAYFLAQLGYRVTLFNQGPGFMTEFTELTTDSRACKLAQWEMDRVMGLNIDRRAVGNPTPDFARRLVEDHAAIYDSTGSEAGASFIPPIIALTSVGLPSGGIALFRTQQAPNNSSDSLTYLATNYAKPGKATKLPRNYAFIQNLAIGKHAAMQLDCALRQGAGASVTEAPAAGLGVASFENYCNELNGTGLTKGETTSKRVVRFKEINLDHFDRRPRLVPSTIEKVFRADQAQNEAGRCFNCGMCTFCFRCYDYCPDLSILMDGDAGYREIDYDHCKGCGICVTECPRGAIVERPERET